MGGTGVSCLDSWFVLFIYSLIFFWIRFFSSLKEFFLIDPKCGMEVYLLNPLLKKKNKNFFSSIINIIVRI